MMGREFSRTFEVNGNRLIVTSAPDEPHLQGVTRWTWERVPPVESLGPTYKQVVGFWQHVVEQRVNVATGAVLSETKRAPNSRPSNRAIRSRQSGSANARQTYRWPIPRQ